MSTWCWKAQTHHRAKCRQTWSSVVETLQFFEFSEWPPPPSWIFEIAKFYWLLWQRGSRHISMPNFVTFGQSVAKILRFFRFFKMAAAAILDCQIHKILLADRVRRAQTHHCTKFCQNRSFRYDYCDFSNFQDGRRRNLVFLKTWNFIHYWGPELRDASACQIL